MSGYALRGELPKLPDLSGFARRDEIPKLPDLSGFARKTELPKLPDLTDYAHKKDIPKVPDVSIYARRDELPKLPDLTRYAMKSEIPSFPDLTRYALKAELPSLPDLTGYARRTELPDVTGYVRSRDVERMLAEKDRLIGELTQNLTGEVSLRTSEIARLEELLREARQTTVVQRTVVQRERRPRAVAKKVVRAKVTRIRAKRKPDDLELIWGIGPVLARRLHAMGIHYFRQIAKWNEKEITRVQEQLETVPDRVRREEWVEQAGRLQHEKNPKEIRPARFNTAN